MAIRLACVLLLALLAAKPAAAQTTIILEDFNVDEGKFTWAPTGSGSTNNIQTSSTANQVTTMALEGAGSQELVLLATTPDVSARMRHVAGGGVTANNTPFSTGPDVDGWIGFALKTDSPGWTASLWIELAPNEAGNPGGVNNNAGIPKDVIADGQWHVYEWDLDNVDGPLGDGNGWTDVAGIIDGTEIVADGNHTIDSIIFRNPAAPATSTIYLDFIAVNRNGSIADVIPTDPTGNADFDGSGVVDGNDLLIWQRNLNLSGQTDNSKGDADASGTIDAADLGVWNTQFGGAGGAVSAVPEAASVVLAVAGGAAVLALRRRRA